MVEFRQVQPKKTTGEHILEIVKLLQQDIVEMKKRLGDEAMEPLDRRLKRMEAKLHSIGDGTWQQKDDGMNR